MRTAERAAEGTCGSFPRLFWCEARGSGQAGARHWQPLHILQVGVLASSLACALLAGLLPSYWRVKEHPHSGPARFDSHRSGQAIVHLFGSRCSGRGVPLWPAGRAIVAVWLLQPMRIQNGTSNSLYGKFIFFSLLNLNSLLWLRQHRALARGRRLTRPMRLLNEAGIFSTCCCFAQSAGCLPLVISLTY